MFIDFQKQLTTSELSCKLLFIFQIIYRGYYQYEIDLKKHEQIKLNTFKITKDKIMGMSI